MPASSGLLFYGEAIDSIYTRDNVYWLRRGPGLPWIRPTRPAVTGGPASFLDEAHAEEDQLPATVVSPRIPTATTGSGTT